MTDTEVVNGVKVLTYNEWVELPDVVKLLSNADDCEACLGEGSHECDCGDTHKCRACNGTGKAFDSRDVYEGHLRYELVRLAEWREGLPRATRGKTAVEDTVNQLERELEYDEGLPVALNIEGNSENPS